MRSRPLLIRPPGNSSRSVAIDLGISSESFRRWVIQAEVDHGASPDLRPTTLRADQTPAGEPVPPARPSFECVWIGHCVLGGNESRHRVAPATGAPRLFHIGRDSLLEHRRSLNFLTQTSGT